MADNTPYTNTPYTQPGAQARPQDHVRETRDTTVIKSGNSNGVIAAVVLFVLLGIAGFIFWTGGESGVQNTATPAAETNIQVTPPADTMQAAPPADAVPVPAPAAPAEIAPAAPSDAAPAPAAPANGG